MDSTNDAAVSEQNKIKVRRVGVDDWPLWRKLRLHALEEAPYAFSSRLVDWQGRGDTEARWRARVSDVPLNIVAEWQETAAGMASGTTPNPDGSVELISMWVAPFARGRGVGDALVNAVIEWAREQQASTVALGVLEGNERAVAFYRRHGFIPVGASVETVTEHRMVRDFSQGFC
jgi:ribosomal protein S18 acetylase RimI-like enzyme